MSNTSTQLKKGLLDLCVLSLLRSEDHYGYDLVKRITKFIDITEGTVYPLLKRLKDNGYVETYLIESKDGAPRKYYKLTKNGEIEYESLYQEWLEFRDSVDNMLKSKKK